MVRFIRRIMLFPIAAVFFPFVFLIGWVTEGYTEAKNMFFGLCSDLWSDGLAENRVTDHEKLKAILDGFGVGYKADVWRESVVRI
ncbi:MAG: hypothetical protein JRC60_08145, partial [Deltaproteobacteria bacterium]|nr:hypothetical protein [Deltaproteobacteria bacterium]